MYSKNGDRYFVVDSHVHFWNAAPDNWRNAYGEGFIKCFYDYHKNLSPPEWVWSFEKYCRYTEQDLVTDLFEEGYVDKAVFLPTYLSDFYHQGFNTTEQDGEVAERHPGRFIVNTAWDPRDGEQGLAELEAKAKRWGSQGVKLYTAEWRGSSRGWKLNDPWALRYLEKTAELGLTNVHVHKGPTIWPLNRDAFDVADVDEAATLFPQLNFIVEHVGLPRLEDFCWIAAQEPNVYGGLAVAMPFIHAKPRYFAKVLGELLFWLGEDRLLFASDYAIWSPKWLVERFVDFQYPADMAEEYGEISVETKQKILGLNAARLYDIPVPAEAGQPAPVAADRVGGWPEGAHAPS